MPISTGPGVTQVEAFKEIKDRVSSAALHGAAGLTERGEKWSSHVKYSKREGKKAQVYRAGCQHTSQHLSPVYKCSRACWQGSREISKMGKPTRKIQPSV